MNSKNSEIMKAKFEDKSSFSAFVSGDQFWGRAIVVTPQFTYNLDYDYDNKKGIVVIGKYVAHINWKIYCAATYEYVALLTDRRRCWE